MTSLADLPDDVLIKMFNIASPRDVARAKRVNRRFHQLVETYNLGKPRVKEFSIESRVASTPPRIGRIRFGPSKPAKRRLVVTMKRDRGVKQVSQTVAEESHPSTSDADTGFVQENLRKVVLEDRLSFDGVTIDDDFYRMLTSRWNNLRHVNTVSLSFCTIRISHEQFIDLLSRMTLRHLYLDFCTFNSSLISDKTLMELPHLETLKIQPRTHCHLNQLTDRTINYWLTDGTIPKSIQIYNCGSAFSLEGLKNLMDATFHSCDEKLKSTNIDWDFGFLLDAQTNSILYSVMHSPGVIVHIDDDSRSRRVNLQKAKIELAFNIFHPSDLESRADANRT